VYLDFVTRIDLSSLVGRVCKKSSRDLVIAIWGFFYFSSADRWPDVVLFVIKMDDDAGETGRYVLEKPAMMALAELE
jgi:hypothetical protein